MKSIIADVLTPFQSGVVIAHSQAYAILIDNTEYAV
jgi:hypothetical protein